MNRYAEVGVPTNSVTALIAVRDMPATMFTQRFPRYFSTRERRIITIGISTSTAAPSKSV